jgi:RHS repeat-associated protein
LGLVVTKTYDKVGNLKEVTDSQQRTTKYEYDELNRQTSVLDAEGGITSYTYYHDGQTKSVKDAANNTTSYTYDGAGRLSSEQSVLGTRTYGYNAADNRTSVVDRNGRTTNYDYDNLNRVKSELWVGNGKTFTYTYDKNSNRLTASDGNVGYSYSYDERDLLSQVTRTDSNVSFKYSYDGVGNLTKSEELVNNAITATTSYQYDDPRSLNTEIIQTGNNLATKRVKFSYDQFGLNTDIDRYVDNQLAVTTKHDYDVYGRLKSISHSNNAGVIGESSYDLDLLNRLTAENKDGTNREFGYDKTDQVKTVSGSNSEAYEYDKNGNRTNTGYVTGTGNRLMSDGVYSYQYDNEGNRTKRTYISSGEVEEYSWDYRNRLTQVVKKDASGVVLQTVSYEYDVDDQRVSKQLTVDSGQLTVTTRENYYLDGNQIAFVTDAQGNQTFHYLYGLNVDQVLAQEDLRPTTYDLRLIWSLADRLGSIDTLTDASGNVVQKRTFDSFGNLLTQTNPNIEFRYGYTGRELDSETGLHYYRARYYDAGVGRFISVDPIGFDAGDTNLYRYVGNSSTMYTDPSGEVAFLANLGAGGFNAVLDVGLQLAFTGKVELGSVATSFVTGALGFGLAEKLSKVPMLANVASKYSVATAVATNALADGAVGGAVQVGSNVLTGKNWSDDVWATATKDALFGGVGAAAFKGAGAAWDKYGDSVVGKLWNQNGSKVITNPALDEALAPSTSRLEELRAKYGNFTAGDINDRINLRGATQNHLQDLIDSGFNKNQIGPVVAGVLDRKTGNMFFGTNSLLDGKGNSILPENLHPTLLDRIKNIPSHIRDGYTAKGNMGGEHAMRRQLSNGAGTHAEIFALNDALNSRSNAQLDDFLVYAVKGPKAATAKSGKRGLPVPRCPHCDYLTQGVKFFPEVLKHSDTSAMQNYHNLGVSKLEDIIFRGQK